MVFPPGGRNHDPEDPMRQSKLPTAFCSQSPHKDPPLLQQARVPAFSETALAEREVENRPGLPQEPASAYSGRFRPLIPG